MENYIIEMETVKRQYIKDKQNLKRYFNLCHYLYNIHYNNQLIEIEQECPICCEVKNEFLKMRCCSFYNICSDCFEEIDKCPICRGKSYILILD